MAEYNETDRLLTNENRQYDFNSKIAREQKRRIKQFQCFLCATFVSLVIMALIMSIIFSMTATFNDTPNSNSTTNGTVALENLNLLLTRTWPLDDKKLEYVTPRNVSLWQKAFTFGRIFLDEKDKMEENVPSLPIDSPSYRHQRVTATSKKAFQLARIGHLQENAMKYVHSNSNRNKSEVEHVCFNGTSELISDDFCQENQLRCNERERYRSFDGSCNNLKNPVKFGAAFLPFRRSLPADYGDGISSPRLSKSGESLPSARTVSLVVHRPYYRDDIKFSVMLAVWGQFLDHDITATALSKGLNGSSISCCVNVYPFHPECFPVRIDGNDPLRTENITCMEFVRSAPAPTCCLGSREQMNQVTAFIDGSVIYGVEKPLATDLRKMEGGLLKMFITKDNRTLLPLSENLKDGCNREEAKKKGEYCFEAGDARSNENLHLTSMHTLWARQHNKLAENLSHINPHWDDEKLFQEARKIIGAQMQHITYNEFLPILLGPALMRKLDLHPQKTGYFHKYNSSMNPSIANNFATAAFRFAHTIIPGLMKLLRNDTESPEFIQMHKMLFNPFKLYESGEMDRVVRGAINTNIEANDPYFTNELKQHLFERDSNLTSEKPKRYGLDLVSLNIQRGRDHGLPGYPEWRKHCGLKIPGTVDDLSDEMDEQSLKNIKSLYRNVSDVDLYTGALSEKPLNGSILGPTLTCLILDQFVRLKYGDRFWYETPSGTHGFNPKQLDEIRKTSLAKIICDNSDNVTYSQLRVMERAGEGNENTHCPNIPGMNLELWKERLTKVEIGEGQNEMKISEKN